MKLKAQLAVAVAAQVNTAVLNQLWLVKHGILAESDLPNSVFIGGVVQAKTPHFEFLALPDRIQFSATESGDIDDSGSIAFEKCKALVELLPHTPFTALGLNFVWLIETPRPEHQGRLVFSARDSILDHWFSASDSRFGGYASCHFEGDLRLKLTVMPITTTDTTDKTEHLQAAFNYHADVTSKDSLLNSLALWPKARSHSEAIATDLDKRVRQCLAS